jgi:hypothetical protein
MIAGWNRGCQRGPLRRSPGGRNRACQVLISGQSGVDTMTHVDMGAWTFIKAESRLEVSRQETEEGLVLVITESSGSRSYKFQNTAALVRCQADMEKFLLRTGWTFLAFSPDRRTGRERRRFPRLLERRRWWTDGLPPPRRSRRKSERVDQ